MKFAPCSKNRTVTTTPPSKPNGFRSVKRLPVKSPALFIGTPATIFAKATPQRTGGSHDPMIMHQSQPFLHLSLSTFPRYSNATPRIINATRMISKGK